MKFQPGDLVWCSLHRVDLKLYGEYPGVVIELREPQRYLVEVEGLPCPFSHPGVPTGLWSAKDRHLRPRRPPGDEIEKQDWVKMCKLRWLPAELVQG